MTSRGWVGVGVCVCGGGGGLVLPPPLLGRASTDLCDLPLCAPPAAKQFALVTVDEVAEEVEQKEAANGESLGVVALGEARRYRRSSRGGASRDNPNNPNNNTCSRPLSPNAAGLTEEEMAQQEEPAGERRDMSREGGGPCRYICLMPSSASLAHSQSATRHTHLQTTASRCRKIS